jgi:hypothetical protein
MRHNTYTRMAIMKTNKKKEEKKNNKWRYKKNCNLYTLLMERKSSTITLENSLEVPHKINFIVTQQFHF